jgi:asparagine synthase (glutamine-hydrolysing)
MTTSYFGGIWQRGRAEHGRRGSLPPSPGSVEEDWGWMGGSAELFVRGAPACARLFTWDALAILLRGHVRPRGPSGGLDLERVAEEVRCHYLERGELAVDDLDGSFTLALLDGQAERVMLYRNLVGSGMTYYHAGPDGLLFGSNLAELTDLDGGARPNRDALPAFFLYRCVPGRETLFADFYRLLPGELVCWDARGLRRVQRHGFADLRADGPTDWEGALEGLEATMKAVLADCAALRPGAANLLSGGIDSSYLQSVWNRHVSAEELPPSFSVSVDHACTWMDTDYAVTASQALGTRHHLVPADGHYADHLLGALAATAEPPNHVQSAYFGHLARAMRARGATAGLCGEGADSLFGLGLANRVHNAEALRKLLPARGLRQLAAAATGAAGWPLLAAACRLADRIDDWTDLEHPVNRVAAFADWGAVEACFGASGVAEAAADRRRLLDQYAVPEGPMDRLHAAGFLGEAVDSAGLWATLFNAAGADLLCPFLDSRVVRFALGLPAALRYPFRRPKALLKRALARHAPERIATRVKLGFGQPIFEWLAPGGQLAPLVEAIAPHDFVDGPTLRRARQRPTWFLYSLLCYDLWHKLFIERSVERPATLPGRRQEGAPLARVS